MAYQMVEMTVTLNKLEGHSLAAGFFKCYPLNICAAFYMISTDSVLMRFHCISRASCFCELANTALSCVSCVCVHYASCIWFFCNFL